MSSSILALKILNQLKHANLLKLSYCYVKDKVEQLCSNYAYTALMISPGWGKLHRAIKYEKKPTNIRDLAYPPAKKVTLGRVNLPGTPMFYCSGNPIATFF